jgi:hypothetical protein
MKRVTSVVATAAILAGCASTSDRIGASYVSPATYTNYDCSQIRLEMERVADRVRQTAGAQNRQAQNEQIATGIGLVLFWPALFMLAGPDRKDELANLKGHFDALSQVQIEKKCGLAEPPKRPKTLI